MMMMATPILILQYYVASKLITVYNICLLSKEPCQESSTWEKILQNETFHCVLRVFCETLLALRKNRENQRIAETLDHKTQHAGANKINL